jgi:hypothetical protein
LVEEEAMNEETTLGLTQSAEGPPLDFAEYFGARLSLPTAEALSVLGRCLLEYEPLQRYESLER